jgi:glycosyltransferase involved in cell wall biosynthesis
VSGDQNVDAADGGDSKRQAYPVMVLAHNEERHIGACLDSIFAGEDGMALEVFVMANGCTDGTEAIVESYARRQPKVHLVSIALGDKCNAWNVFIHETVPAMAPRREAYFFMDGDARVARGSFAVMLAALRQHPQAHAASAVPGSGRNCELDAKDIVEKHGLVANLYALRGVFVERLRQSSVRIPLKLEGDDGLIGALVKWDLEPRANGFDDSRIAPCADARFEFESMSLARLADWRMYWKRAVRYGRRRYEFQLLGKRLKAEGLGGLPRDVTELYPDAESLPLRWEGVYTLPNWFARRAMRRRSQ